MGLRTVCVCVRACANIREWVCVRERLRESMGNDVSTVWRSDAILFSLNLSRAEDFVRKDFLSISCIIPLFTGTKDLFIFRPVLLIFCRTLDHCLHPGLKSYASCQNTFYYVFLSSILSFKKILGTSIWEEQFCRVGGSIYKSYRH